MCYDKHTPIPYVWVIQHKEFLCVHTSICYDINELNKMVSDVIIEQIADVVDDGTTVDDFYRMCINGKLYVNIQYCYNEQWNEYIPSDEVIRERFS